MGFGAFDESEQENHEYDTDEVEIDDDDDVKAADATHDGEVKFEGMTDTDSLLNRLDNIKTDDS